METKIIITDVKNWNQTGASIVTGEGLVLGTAQQKDVAKFFKVPATLLSVDANHGTSTFTTVLRTIPETKKVKLLVDASDEVVSVIDPKSTFITDEQYEETIDKIARMGFEAKEESRGPVRKTRFDIVDSHDSFLGDAFKRRLMVERCLNGGMFMSLDLLRLACTNGMLVPDNQFKHLARNKAFDDGILQTFVTDLASLSLDDYLTQLWQKDGQFVQASVSDFLGMKRTLATITDKEVADQYFPEDPIDAHYSAQNIDLTRINDRLRSRMPSGLSYYDCFNILTHGVKQATDYTLEDEIKVANWAKPSRLLQLKQSDISFHGVPLFDERVIQVLKGDRPE